MSSVRSVGMAFVESLSAVAQDSPPVPTFRTAASEEIDDLFFGNQFLQVLRRIAQDAHEEDAPPPPPSEHVDPTDNDYLRIELGGWDVEDNEDDDEHSVEMRHEDENENRERDNRDLSDNDEEENEVIEERGSGQDVDDTRRRRRDFLRVRLRDFAARAATRRNRVLDWADILMGLQDLELQLQVPGSDTFIGNPGDYVDAAGYEALLQNLVENDNGGRRGAPPSFESGSGGFREYGDWEGRSLIRLCYM
ncbi:E3 ubiquitin-protein ligase CIP8 [Abeliophyllum distichum]|uniref:E3 ubiquitin-protein ligase CIP8 n=1 Tax=Abeliophyllum distichum TaxID=126358 RepID=A0ABD1SG29_9LAMI